jgi:hypothetical protein
MKPILGKTFNGIMAAVDPDPSDKSKQAANQTHDGERNYHDST